MAPHPILVPSVSRTKNDQRPSMSIVLQMLKGDFKSFVIPPKPFVSSDDEMDAN
ncbi:hypothetical protein Pint_22114 [Pistacia integerrima]|uniref:Uncharacterized protein n=1 Tax=Pistacia integerrima TaxID=434235 RepID=A0ACC0YKF0_9ROSI|nr:hypothetical protein Pint_22114 [Pistacia integerrima]